MIFILFGNQIVYKFILISYIVIFLFSNDKALNAIQNVCGDDIATTSNEALDTLSKKLNPGRNQSSEGRGTT